MKRGFKPVRLIGSDPPRVGRMHGSLTNMTPNRLRLNADVRYQRRSEPMDPRYSPDKLVK